MSTKDFSSELNSGTVVSTVDLRPNLCHCFSYCFLQLQSSRQKIATLAMGPWGRPGYLCSPLNPSQLSPHADGRPWCGNFLPATALPGPIAFSHRTSPPPCPCEDLLRSSRAIVVLASRSQVSPQRSSARPCPSLWTRWRNAAPATAVYGLAGCGDLCN